MAPDDQPGSPARAEGLGPVLARALEQQAQLRVVAVDDASPAQVTSSQVRKWALETGADAVVTPYLEQQDLRVELRSAHSGGLLGSWTVAGEPDAAALLGVMSGIRQGLGLEPTALPAVADGQGEDESVRPLLGSLRSDGPISIQSEQLDVVSHGGRRHLLFQHNVRVQQGDIRLRADTLDAYYAEGDSQPERLVARGGVLVTQGDRVANCEEATYLQAEQLIICSGSAELVQGCDVVRGGRIEFDLEREHFTVMGAASVVLGREDETCGAQGES